MNNVTVLGWWVDQRCEEFAVYFFCFGFFSDKAENENKTINKIKPHKTKQNSGRCVCVLECE